MPDTAFGEIRLEGRHVRLEPLAPEHMDALLAAADDKEIWDWFSVAISDRAAAELFVHQALRGRDAGAEYPFAVISKSSGHVIGSTRYLDAKPEHRTLEIGYTWYSRATWGTEINPECKLLLMEYAFEKWQANRVALKTDIGNAHSQAAIRKLGAQYEGTLRNDRIRRDGSMRDTVVFSVIRPEWPSVKEDLTARLG